MDRLSIIGGERLQGSVRIGGAKNAALPILAAALLSPAALTLTNVPEVSDVASMLALLGRFGARVDRAPHRLVVQAETLTLNEAGYDLVRRMRAAFLVAGPPARPLRPRPRVASRRLRHRRPAGRSAPGGAGAAWAPSVAVSGGMIDVAAPQGLAGARILLAFPSVGATQTRSWPPPRRGAKPRSPAPPRTGSGRPCRLPCRHGRADRGRRHATGSGCRARPPGAARHAIIADRIEAGTYADRRGALPAARSS